MTKKSPSSLEQGFYLHLKVQDFREQNTEVRGQRSENRLRMTEIGIRKWDGGMRNNKA
jgi:hypothetical protein